MPVNKVWIEIEYPSIKDFKTEEEKHAKGRERAEQLSAMLRRLGVQYAKPVFWHSREERYCFTVDEGGAYVVATDNGHWYNLDYFGRSEGKERAKR